VDKLRAAARYFVVIPAKPVPACFKQEAGIQDAFSLISACAGMTPSNPFEKLM
jgi:hypothetical protein